MTNKSELYAPKEWFKYHYDIVNEAIDPHLYDVKEIVQSLAAADICHDKPAIIKYEGPCNTYRMMCWQIPVLPDNPLSRKCIKLWAEFSVGLFFSDDMLETWNENEMRQLCDAFQMLNENLCEQFPEFPTMNDMKHWLSQRNVNEKVIPQCLFLTTFGINIAKSVIHLGTFSQDDVKDYWRRMVVVLALYYEGVKTNCSPKEVPLDELLWRRIFNSGTSIYHYSFQPVFGLIGKLKAHMTLIHELGFLNTMFVAIINDVYSFVREGKAEDLGFIMCNVLIRLKEENAAPAGKHTVENAVQVLNGILKVVYKKIEMAKEEYANNTELCNLLDNFGASTVGWYFFHHFSGRYKDHHWPLSLVEVSEKELEEWKNCKEEDLPEEVKYILIKFSAKAKRFSDRIESGVVDIHANLLPA
uniref:TPS5 n=1 Tax=Erythropodium caribaeorum TaxID=86550 RepID=A0A8T9VYE5_9CNID|nr:TPS5 [Erythropodium caribaeorum]